MTEREILIGLVRTVARAMTEYADQLSVLPEAESADDDEQFSESDNPLPELASQSEIARRLGVHRNTVARWKSPKVNYFPAPDAGDRWRDRTVYAWERWRAADKVRRKVETWQKSGQPPFRER